MFDGSGALVSSEVEAVSDYKSRNRLVLVGPPKSEGETSTPAIPGTPAEQNPDVPADIPASGPAEIPAEPPVPEEPPAVVVIPPSEE